MTASIYRQVKELERLADDFGFCISPSTFNRDALGLYPKDEKLPIYSRDAQLMSGTVNELLSWFYGYGKAMEYAKMLGFKQEPAEQKYLDARAAQKLRDEKRQVIKILKSE